MKAIIRKELRQGRPLLVFSVVMVALLAGTRLLLVHSLHDPRTWQTVNAPFDLYLLGVMLALPLLLAFFASIGLFSAEAEHGVLPVLFMLPLSRPRLWTAKLLAGALLTLTGSALLLLACRLLMPALFVFAGLTPWLDLALLTIFVLAVGLFVTVFAPHAIGAAATTVALGFGLLLVTSVFRKTYGASLLGYDELLETDLWLFLTTPALLFVSWRALVRGELLEWRRSALLHLLVLLVGLVLTAGVVCLLGRAATRYDRRSTGLVVAPSAPPGASALTLLSSNRPVPYCRTRVDNYRTDEMSLMRIGWGARQPARDPEDSADPLRSEKIYYRNHAVISLDVRTGKELASHRDSILRAVPVAAVSPDGRYAALATAPVGATWGGVPAHTAARHLEVRDLRTGHRLYSGVPAPLLTKARQDQGVVSLSWSATGHYLALGLGWSDGGVASSLYLMRPDGSALHSPVTGRDVRDWVWSPREDVLYVLRAGAAERLTPNGAHTVLWPAEIGGPEQLGEIAGPGLSPDGRWLALQVLRSPSTAAPWNAPQPDDSVPATAHLAVASTDGRRRQVLWEIGGVWNFSFAWYGNTLFALATRQERAKDIVTTGRGLLRWRPGEADTTDLGTLPYPGGKLLPVAGRGVLLLPERMDPDARPRPETASPWPPVGVTMLDTEGHVVGLPGELPSPTFAATCTAVTVDNAARLITVEGGQSRQRLVATDLATGKQTQVYP